MSILYTYNKLSFKYIHGHMSMFYIYFFVNNHSYKKYVIMCFKKFKTIIGVILMRFLFFK